ncbi:MAG: IPT/TIG domain-containing protein [Sideroxydans sp.]|nr:IPT/TIG domain-containing protein [Sideroxydans sp.]
MYSFTKMLRLSVFIFLFILSACGGGAGGGSSGPSLGLSTSILTFNAANISSTPPPQTVTATINGSVSGTIYILIVSTGPAVSSISNITITGPTTGEATVYPASASTLGPGVHSSTITVTACTSDPTCTSGVIGIPQTINVTYTVGVDLSVSPTAVTYFAGPNIVPAAKTVSLSSNGASASWTSAIDYGSGPAGWLSINPASVSAMPSNVSVNVTGMLAGTYKANITFTSGGSSISVPVSYVVKAEGVTFVSPYVGTTSVAGDVIIRGFGFSTLSNLNVLFGAAAATSVSVISDTEIRASYPALAAGNYSVIVKNATQTLPTRAQLTVVDAPSLSYAAITRPSGATSGLLSSNLIYDAERRAIILCDINGASTDRLERYRFNGSSWVMDSVIDFGYPHIYTTTIALSPDGTELLKSEWGGINHVDLASWTTTGMGSASSLSIGAQLGGRIAVTNDGGVVGPTYTPNVFYWYDILDRNFIILATPSSSWTALNRFVSASGDGSRLILPNTVSSSNALYYYDSGNQNITSTSVMTTYSNMVSVNRTGSRSIVLVASGQYAVYDSAFNNIGALPTLDAAVISASGNTAYTYVSSNNAIHKYDLNIPNGSGGFTEIGSGTVLADSPGTGIAMTISPDGGTLFLAGSLRVLIVPVP